MDLQSEHERYLVERHLKNLWLFLTTLLKVKHFI